MVARRDFVYHRDHDKLSAIISSIAAANTPSPSAASSPDPATSDPFEISIPLPTPKTTNSATQASSSTASPSSSPTASSNSASTSASTSSNSTPSSASAQTTSSSSSASLLIVPSITSNVPIVATNGAATQFAPTSSLTPSTTSTPHASGGISAGLVIGAVAGSLVGIAVLGFLLTWCMRRRQDNDLDDFDAQAFKRQSAILVDDPLEPPRSYNNTRQPAMVEQHNASPALAAQAGYGQNFYGNYSGYDQQPTQAPEMVRPAASTLPQPYGAAQMGYTGYNDPPPQQLSRQPSNGAYLTRQPTTTAGYTPPPAPPASFDPNTHYIDLNRSSVSPFQAAQYADISRRLGTSDPNGQAPRESLQIPDDPLPSPFDDPAQPVGSAVTSPHVHANAPHMVTPIPVTTTPVYQTQGNIADPHQRVTIYEDGDAYGGI